MYTLGALLLMAVLVGAVIAVVDSVLGAFKLDGIIKGLPVIGAHWGLGFSILTVWVVDNFPAYHWGLEFSHHWMNIVAHGAIIYGMIPLKDAVISMVNKGLRA